MFQRWALRKQLFNKLQPALGLPVKPRAAGFPPVSFPQGPNDVKDMEAVGGTVPLMMELVYQTDKILSATQWGDLENQ